MIPEAMKTTLNLGCGNSPWPNAVNHDRTKHRPEVDVVHDLNVLPWPWEDEAFDQIIASAVLEHLDVDLLGSLNECWRLLRPGGTIYIKVPYWSSPNSYADPTHRWFCDLTTFDVFDPDTKFGLKYGFYTTRKWRIIKPARLNKEKTSVIISLEVRKP